MLSNAAGSELYKFVAREVFVHGWVLCLHTCISYTLMARGTCQLPTFNKRVQRVQPNQPPADHPFLLPGKFFMARLILREIACIFAEKIGTIISCIKPTSLVLFLSYQLNSSIITALLLEFCSVTHSISLTITIKLDFPQFHYKK